MPFKQHFLGLIFAIIMFLVSKTSSVAGFTLSKALLRRRPALEVRLPLLTQLYAVRHRTTRLNEWEMGGGKNKTKKTKEKGKKGKGAEAPKNGRTEDSQSPLYLTQGKVIEEGLVIERLGDRLLIRPDKDPARKMICSQRSRLCDATIVVGDRVDFFEFDNDNEKNNGNMAVQDQSSDARTTGGEKKKYGSLKGVVVDHKERNNVLQRPAGGGNIRTMKSIAANVDQLMLVVSGSPLVPLATVDRMMVVAHKHNMRCVLVLNKVDDKESTRPFRESITHYSKLGYKIIEVSSKTGEGMGDLRTCLRDKSSVFVGQSGVGKSSLINALLPGTANAHVGELVRSSNQIGAHTTSSSHLFHLGEYSGDIRAGTIIDSPGIREVGLWHLPIQDIKEGFVEIYEHSKNCKYRNCSHDFDQDGCGIIRALEQGLIEPRRYSSFRDLTDD